ncbi:MAG: hypothetical protein JXR83_11820 [Deltaproteobacteria bacterium]|nr:hypothetical protein [Deltaproteobacteria bacterium]
MKGQFFGLAFGAVLTIALATGCPEEKKTVTKHATVTLTAVDENNEPTTSVLADGADYALLQIVAKDASEAAWAGTIQMSTDRGAFDASQFLADVELTTDSSGQAAIRFLCVDPATGDPAPAGVANITARNALASARLMINCESFTPSWALQLRSPSGTSFYANGFTEVPLVATALGLRGTPEQGARINFRVDDNSRHLCTVDNSPCVANALHASLNVETDSQGEAVVLVQAPSSAAAVDVVATWTYDSDAEPKTATASLYFSEDQSAIVVSPSRNAIPANNTATVTLTATAINFDGTPMPEGTNVTFRVNPPYTVGSPASATTTVAIAGSAGQATTVLNASATVGTAVVAASFEVVSSQVRTSEPVSVTFAEAGRMLLSTAAVPEEIFTDDATSSLVTVTVERDGTPVSGQQMTFSLSASDTALATFGVQGTAVDQQQVTTNAQGQAAVDVRGLYAGAAGTIAVMVSTYDTQRTRDESTIQTVLLKRHPILQSVVFVGADPDVLGTRGSPRTSTATVTFRAFNDNALPMEGIEFRFPRPITIDPTVTITTIGGGDTTLSDSSGAAVAYLAAGVQAHPVRVIAEATDPRTGTVVVVTSDAIPIVAGLASFSHSWFVCDQDKAAMAPPNDRSCSVVLADRFSERVPAGTSTQFRVEAGNITPSAVTGDNGGSSDIEYLTGTPYPADTRDKHGNLGTPNPKDGLVSMLAYTRGEEPFTDLDGNGVHTPEPFTDINGNGQYDFGEPFVDLTGNDTYDATPFEPFVDFPEPYLDKQDNCVRNDATEPSDEYFVDPSLYPGNVADPYLVLRYTDTFVDGNNDGRWNGPNEVWDADTLIWFQEQTLWVYDVVDLRIVDADCFDSTVPQQAGFPNYSNSAHLAYLRRCRPTQDVRQNPATGAWEPFPHYLPWLEPGESVQVRFRAYDFNENCPAPGVTARYSWSAENAQGAGSLPVGYAGCGLGSGYLATDPVTGHLIPYCLVYDNIDVDATLRVQHWGLGAVPFAARFGTGSSDIGVGIKINVKFSGVDNAGGVIDIQANLEYVIPCYTDADCGAVANDGGQTSPEDPRCIVETGKCFKP